MKLYLDNGYLDMTKIINDRNPFVFVIGGRGIGKTYGALKYLIDTDKKFMLMRRTQAQADLISQIDFSPFKSLNNDFSLQITTNRITKYTTGYYKGVKGEDGKIRPAGNPIGYSCALSTISNLRGFDTSDIDIIIYDEFIPEAHERAIRSEGEALLNAYETINRNRELNGRDPVKLIALSNSNDIANPIFIELGIIPIVDKMIKRQQEYYSNNKKGITIINIMKSPISDKKKDTALYNLVNEKSNFYSMATGNDYNMDNGTPIKASDLKQYNPYVTVGDLTFYRHKDGSHKYYCSMHKSGTPPEYLANNIDFQRFRSRYNHLFFSYLSNHIIFESVLAESLFNSYYKTFK